MCGVAGIINFNGDLSDQVSMIEKMCADMYSRGPDYGAVFLTDLNSSICESIDFQHKLTEDGFAFPPSNHLRVRSAVSLGHRRLSILDLSSSANQPMQDGASKCTIVFNGEIYNYKLLRSMLRRSGYVFYTNSDTEVLLKSYLKWGDECVNYLNGDFAFAIWDPRDQSLFCARDRVGIKPFYYYSDANTFIFASTYSAILASFYRPFELDKANLLDVFLFGVSLSPKTPFKGISSLEPAHFMRIQLNGKQEISRFWSIPLSSHDAGTSNQSIDEWSSIVSNALKKSVQLRLSSDVPLGCFLSGGIDSSLVSIFARSVAPDISAYTLSHSSAAPELDETFEASSVARSHQIKHNICEFDDNQVLSYLSEWMEGHVDPYYSLSPAFLICKMMNKAGVKVALSGLGGDELFYGYNRYREAFVRDSIPFSLSGLASFANFIPTERIKRKVKLLAYGSFRDVYANNYASVHSAKYLCSLLGINTLECESLICSRFYDIDLPSYPKLSSPHATSFYDLLHYVGNHQVSRCDGLSMVNSVEMRFPLLDHTLIELVAQVPVNFKVSLCHNKVILRRIAKELIPSQVLSMKKKGFSVPLRKWIDGALNDFAFQYLQCLSRRNIFSTFAIQSLAKDVASSNRYNASEIWLLISIEAWLQRMEEKYSVRL